MQVQFDAAAVVLHGTGLRARLMRMCVAPAAAVAVIGVGAGASVLALAPGPIPMTATLVVLCAALACLAVVAGAFVRGRALAQSVARAAVATPPAAGQPQEVYVGLARRLQGLVHREIQLLDVLEAQVEDPDLLKGLFQVDHLATRMRRYAENLAVVGGAVPRRQWSRPLPLVEVLRSAIAEVEQYARVRVVSPVEGTMRGHAGADVVHLLAELIENATAFAPPQTEVTVRARRVAAGVAIEVDDRGLGMPHPEQDRVNALLADPSRVDVGDLLRDGRIGAWVVSALARRHGIDVLLQSNVYGGMQAVVVLPAALLGDRTAEQPTAVDLGRVPPSSGPTGTPAVPSPSPAGARHRLPAPPPEMTQATPSGAFPAVSVPAVATGQAGRNSGVTRPALPRRERQAHLAAPLRQSRPASVNRPGGDHDPTMMAAFLRGAASSGDPSTAGPGPNHR